MNNNVVIAIVLLVALFGCACGWLYSRRWRSEVRERLFEAEATVRIRRLERQATQPRRAVEGRTGGQPSPASRPVKTKGGSKKKNKGKKPPPRPKQRPQQQEWSSDNQQDGQEGITDTYDQDQARDQDQGQDQDSSSPWGSVDPVDQSEANPSATSTTTADYSAPDACRQASESDGRWSNKEATASAASEWPTDGNSSSGQEWESDGQREDDPASASQW